MTKIQICTLQFDEKTASDQFRLNSADFSVKSSWEIHWIVMSQKDAVCGGILVQTMTKKDISTLTDL